MRSETGFVAARFWMEVAMRKRDQDFELITRFLPSVLFVMSGLGPSVPYEARREMLEPSMREMRASLLGIQRASVYREYQLERKLADLQARKSEMDQLNWINSSEFSLAAWLNQPPPKK